MTRYIAYCRKSTDEADKQILSIDAQIEELKEYAARENLSVFYYIAESKTAKKPGREKFEQMLKLIEKGEADGILSWHPFMSTPKYIIHLPQPVSGSQTSCWLKHLSGFHPESFQIGGRLFSCWEYGPV